LIRWIRRSQTAATVCWVETPPATEDEAALFPDDRAFIEQAGVHDLVRAALFAPSISQEVAQKPFAPQAGFW
jgi:hypothetical protein